MVVVSFFRSMTTALVRRAVQSKRMSQRDNSAVVAVLGAIDEDNAAIREDVLLPPLSTLRMRRSWSSLGHRNCDGADPAMSPQIIESCKRCGSHELQWRNDNGWITRPWRYLECQKCGDTVRTSVPGWTWLMYAIALVAAVWGWIVVAGSDR